MKCASGSTSVKTDIKMETSLRSFFVSVGNIVDGFPRENISGRFDFIILMFLNYFFVERRQYPIQVSVLEVSRGRVEADREQVPSPLSALARHTSQMSKKRRAILFVIASSVCISSAADRSMG